MGCSFFSWLGSAVSYPLRFCSLSGLLVCHLGLGCFFVGVLLLAFSFIPCVDSHPHSSFDKLFSLSQREVKKRKKERKKIVHYYLLNSRDI